MGALTADSWVLALKRLPLGFFNLYAAFVQTG